VDRSLEAMVSIAGGWPGELNLGPGGWPGELNLGPHQNRSADLTWGAAPLCLSRVRGLTFPRLLLGRSDFGPQRIDADQACWRVAWRIKSGSAPKSERQRNVGCRTLVPFKGAGVDVSPPPAWSF